MDLHQYERITAGVCVYMHIEGKNEMFPKQIQLNWLLKALPLPSLLKKVCDSSGIMQV